MCPPPSSTVTRSSLLSIARARRFLNEFGSAIARILCEFNGRPFAFCNVQYPGWAVIPARSPPVPCNVMVVIQLQIRS